MSSQLGGSPIYPNSDDVIACLKAFAGKHPERSRLLRLGRSGQGRPLLGITVGDPGIPSSEKQAVLILAGRHGNEESGRAQALALLDWLVSKAGRETLLHQEVTILPNCNPDGCEADIYHTPDDKNICDDLDGPAPIPESLAVEKVAQRLLPDLIVDLHSRGFAGCSYDMVLYPAPVPYTEDDNLFHQVAAEMCEAGELAGVPQMAHPLAWWHADDKGVCARYYKLFKSFPILMETSESNEHAHPLELRQSSGIAKLAALLAWGNRKHPKLQYPGYPCTLLMGSFCKGIVARGKTPGERRRSRVDVWRNRGAFSWESLGGPQQDRHKVLGLRYEGEPLTKGINLQLQVRNRVTPMRVRLNGRKARGVDVWHAANSTFISVPVPRLSKGLYQVEIDL